MKVNLLKINAAKKFNRLMEETHVATYLWDSYNPLGKIYLGLEKREERASYRDKLCRTKAKLRKTWEKTYDRIGRGMIADKLLNYVKERYARKRK